MEQKHIIAALAALAQESRLAVFRLLVQAGPQGLAATKIAEHLGIAPSSLSFHLKELTHADLVSQTKAGRSLIYSANFQTMNGLLGFLTENCCGGNVCSPVVIPQRSDEAISKNVQRPAAGSGKAGDPKQEVKKIAEEPVSPV